MLKEIDEQPTVMRKLIQAYTDEAGQVVVDPAIIRLFKMQTVSTSLAAGTSYQQDLLLKKMLEELTDTISGTWNLFWVGYGTHFSARNHSSFYQPIWWNSG